MKKVGRNDPCPCGSGKKVKKCCGVGNVFGRSAAPITKLTGPPWVTQRIASNEVPPEVPAELIRKYKEFQIRKRDSISKFGHVRPEITADFKGHKFVAVGRKLYYDKRWKFFADFLIDYVPYVFGREWFDREIAKPLEERHPVMQWRVNGIKYMRKHQRTSGGGVNRILPSGFLAAYLTFAYDVYVVEHNARLDERLLERLKHPEQFQGARHELFAEATCLRAN